MLTLGGSTEGPTLPRIGSLFSGYGGLDIAALKVLGGSVAWHCENDPAASRVLAHHWPEVPNLGDITAVDWAAVEPVDVLTGGFPCTDVSTAGRRAGLASERSGLWWHMHAAVAALRPSLVIIENVRGIFTTRGAAPTPELLAAEASVERCDTALKTIEKGLSRARDSRESRRILQWQVLRVRHMGRRRRAMAAARRADARIVRAIGAVVGSLADLGYDAQWTGLRAADVGAPHGRWRVFLVAWPAADTDLGGLGQDRRNLRPGQPDVGRCAAADSVGSRRHGWPGTLRPGGWGEPPNRRHAPTDPDGQPVRQQPVAIPRSGGAPVPGSAGSDAAPDAVRAGLEGRDVPGRVAQGGRPDPHHGGLRPTDGRDAPPADTLRDGRDRDTQRDLPAHTGENSTPGGDPDGLGMDWGPYAPAIHRWEQALGRPAPAPTEPGSKGQPRLAPAFVEWLMGLPAGWVTGVTGTTRSDQLRCLGNGVVPQQAVAALRALLDTQLADHTAT